MSSQISKGDWLMSALGPFDPLWGTERSHLIVLALSLKSRSHRPTTSNPVIPPVSQDDSQSETNDEFRDYQDARYLTSLCCSSCIKGIQTRVFWGISTVTWTSSPFRRSRQVVICKAQAVQVAEKPAVSTGSKISNEEINKVGVPTVHPCIYRSIDIRFLADRAEHYPGRRCGFSPLPPYEETRQACCASWCQLPSDRYSRQQLYQQQHHQDIHPHPVQLSLP